MLLLQLQQEKSNFFFFFFLYSLLILRINKEDFLLCKLQHRKLKDFYFTFFFLSSFLNNKQQKLWKLWERCAMEEKSFSLNINFIFFWNIFHVSFFFFTRLGFVHARLYLQVTSINHFMMFKANFVREARGFGCSSTLINLNRKSIWALSLRYLWYDYNYFPYCIQYKLLQYRISHESFAHSHHSSSNATHRKKNTIQSI